MSLTLRTALGYTEAVIDEDGGLKRFYLIANILSSDFKVIFSRKEDDSDAINWSFSAGHYQLILHYSIYNGISLFPATTKKARRKENEAVVEVATALESKLLNMDRRQNIA